MISYGHILAHVCIIKLSLVAPDGWVHDEHKMTFINMSWALPWHSAMLWLQDRQLE